MWPGFGDNVRVLEWILKRCEVKDSTYAEKSAIGWIPAKGALRYNNSQQYFKKSLSMTREKVKVTFIENIQFPSYMYVV